jgi:peptide/nickel transport system permease protein
VLAAVLGPSLENAMIAIGISAMPISIRLARADAGRLHRGYITAARSLGIGHAAVL